VGQPDVSGLEVAVNDPVLMGVFEGAADLLGDAQRLLDGEPEVRGLAQPRLHRAPLHQLAHDVGLAVLLADVEDRDDVWVIAQAPHGLGLAAHAREPLGVEPVGLHQRQRHLAVESRVPGQVDPLAGALAEETRRSVAAARHRAGQGRPARGRGGG
jgi:hypothetical protein